MNLHARHLGAFTVAAALTVTAGLTLGLLVAPIDQDGYMDKIFFVHVPLAIVSLCGFVFGGICGAMYLRTGDRKWDMRSYCAIHMALIFSVGGLISGAIWAKIAWGHWWVWSEPTLVSYLIVVLLFCTYQPLRFSIEDPEKQSRYAAVFSVVGGAFVPLNFIAVRLAVQYTHPRVLNLEGGNMAPGIALAFYVSLLGFALLFAALMKYEMLAKTTRIDTRRLRQRMLGEDTLRPLGRSAAPS